MTVSERKMEIGRTEKEGKILIYLPSSSDHGSEFGVYLCSAECLSQLVNIQKH